MEFALPISTLLVISGHFKQFQLNDLLSQLAKLANIFDKLSAPQYFFHFYGPVNVAFPQEKKEVERSAELSKLVCSFIVIFQGFLATFS